MLRRTLHDLGSADLNGRRALTRVDYNVPLTDDGRVRDDTRVRATVSTLRYLLEHGARPVLLSHLGRPKGRVVPGLSLAPVAAVLAGLLRAPVHFVAATDTADAISASRELADGSVLLLENTRFLPGETANDVDLAERLGLLGDLFVNDAFGSTHRAHASVVGVADHLSPAIAGFLVQAELAALGALREARNRPFAVVLGGAKISDKIGLLETFLERADSILIGGAMANTFLAADGGNTGRSLMESDAVPLAEGFLEKDRSKLHLPTDLVVADPGASDSSSAQVAAALDVPPDLAALDIGPDTRAAFAAIVRHAATVFWNGPMGLFERPGFEAGTTAMAEAAAFCTRAGGFAVVGGGDSASAIREAGLDGSTGGGAALEFLAKGSLPGIDALDPAGDDR
jgi:phosphoglycerate kinase